MRATVCGVLLLVGCATTPAPATPRDEAAAERDATVRQLARLQAGADALLKTPELGLAGWRATQLALLLCERERAKPLGLRCSSELMAQLTATVQRSELLATPVTPSTVSWEVVASPACMEVAHVIGEREAAGSTLRATLELTDCHFAASVPAWRASSCAAAGATRCPDGSAASVGRSDCGQGRPCQPAPATCPCVVSGVEVSAEVRGVVRVGEQRWPVRLVRAGQSSVTANDAHEALPVAPTEKAYFAGQLDGVLPAMGRIVEAAARLEADVESDAAARACAQAERLGANAFNWAPDARCERSFEREPRAPVQVNTTPREPEVRGAGAERRAVVLTADERIATRNAVQAASPGWTVKVGPLGFVTHAEHARWSSDEATQRGLETFASEHAKALGFVERPSVVTNGSGYFGTRWVVGGQVVAKPAESALVLDGHAWPFSCPEPNRAKLLAPWVGAKVMREVPGRPCDRVVGATCTPAAPSTKVGTLALGDVALTPRVLVERVEERTARLRCVVELHLDGALVAPAQLPSAIDLETGEAMVGALENEEAL